MLSKIQDIEWKAWGAIIVKLREIGDGCNYIETDKEEELIEYIKRWGECLALLRKDHGHYQELDKLLELPLAELVDKKWKLKE